MAPGAALLCGGGGTTLGALTTGGEALSAVGSPATAPAAAARAARGWAA
jgi:hypothetical protein